MAAPNERQRVIRLRAARFGETRPSSGFGEVSPKPAQLIERVEADGAKPRGKR
jgi:hypothetical protein